MNNQMCKVAKINNKHLVQYILPVMAGNDFNH